MDWHLLGLSFITVFLSELGDKSQHAVEALQFIIKIDFLCYSSLRE